MAKADIAVPVKVVLTEESYRSMLRLYHELGNALMAMRPDVWTAVSAPNDADT